MDRRILWTSVANFNANTKVFRPSLGVLHEYVEIPSVIENACVKQFILRLGVAARPALFNQLASDPNTTDARKALMQAIITVLNGSRDKALGDDPALYYADAAEVLFLIERLGG